MVHSCSLNLASARNSTVFNSRSDKTPRACSLDIPLRAKISETGLVLLINEQKGEKEEIRDEREFSWCCSFPWGFGCRSGVQRQPKRAPIRCRLRGRIPK